MPTQNKRPTSRDVARLAGVSHMTVSRVVRDIHSVAPETVSRVRAAIEKLGYRPDPTLSALSAYRYEGSTKSHGSVIAFLDCDESDYSDLVFKGVQAEGQNLGYKTEKIRLPRNFESQQKISRNLFNRGIRGLLFGPAQNPWEFPGWDWSKFAPISLCPLTHKPNMPSVVMDYFHGAMTACHLLQKQGCKRIGCLVPHRLETRTGRRWLGGYRVGLVDKAKPRINESEDLATIQEWAIREKLDGIVSANQNACSLFKPRGIRIAFLNSFCPDPEIPRLDFDPAWIGIEGVRLVHHLLLHNELGISERPKMLSLTGDWVVGSGNKTCPVEF